MPLTKEDIKGKVLLCKTPCSNCPFIPSKNAIKLRQGRLQKIARETAQGGQFYCHKGIYDLGHKVLCRGWDAVVQPNATRMAERLGILMEVRLEDLPVLTEEERDKVLERHQHEDE